MRTRPAGQPERRERQAAAPVTVQRPATHLAQPGEHAEQERAARLELELLRTRRDLGELREQVAWQFRLLVRLPDPPDDAGPAARASRPRPARLLPLSLGGGSR